MGWGKKRENKQKVRTLCIVDVNSSELSKGEHIVTISCLATFT